MATVRSYSIFFANDIVTKVLAYDGAETAAATDAGDDVLHVVKTTDLADVSNENLLSLLNFLRPEGSDAFETLPVRKDAIKRIAQSLLDAGSWRGWDGAAYVEMGSTVLDIAAGSINISNIYTGISDGIWYPSSCLSACGG